MKFYQLPLRNLARKPARTWALILLTGFLAMAVFGGTMIVGSLRSGLGSLEGRLGADLIVVPKTARYSSGTGAVSLENILLQGTTGAFYMDAGILDKVRDTEGVEKAAAQTFLASLKADCCSARIQVIGFDRESDFTVQPWIIQSYGKTLDTMDVVVGSNISAGVGDLIRLYDKNCRVVAQLAATGTGLDTAVYCDMNTMQRLLSAAEEKGISHKVTSSNSHAVISAVYVKVRQDADIDRVMTALSSHPRWNVAVIQTKAMITDVSDGLAGVASTVTALIAAVWALAFVILFIAFSMLANERKREFAVLRAVGASKRMLGRMMMTESAVVSLAGGVLGAACGAVLVFSFSGLIESALGMPYLTPGVPAILLTAVAAVALTVLVGGLASARCAYRLSRVDTGAVLREDG